MCRDELLAELAKLEANGKDQPASAQSIRRQQQRQNVNGVENESGANCESDADHLHEEGSNVNASMLSEDLRLLAALN